MDHGHTPDRVVDGVEIGQRALDAAMGLSVPGIFLNPS